MTISVTINNLLAEHWPQVKDIYEKGIASGNATFQTTAPSWEEWDKGHVKSCRLVAVEGDVILGWAVLSQVSARAVYAGVAEVSIYIHPEAQGKGIGSLLLKALIAESEKQQFWTLQAGIFPENIASIRLHEKHGFRLVGRRERIGQMNGIWRDTVLLERRSDVIFQ
ncbi:phosphinothricin acetyltransferase [Chitinophaga sp. CF118]|uniref:GNAT family N-acetyltransferase n=1 Tax=Chitinophaga sp. CF118 TaxID=1884367 RepID=UPI0008F17AC0|nr:GNAT family N-acetyltransferase [Chitinophaga sp. CF118]SFD77238.1 phosphinothricin acetyltransferase [Chitinophaga sp. CF118]